MYNLDGEFFDNFVPLFCSWYRRPINPADKKYCVIFVRLFKDSGFVDYKFFYVAFSSSIRSRGLADKAFEIILSKY